MEGDQTMPIHVDVYINERHIKSYHIGRESGTTAPDSVNRYWIHETEGLDVGEWTGENEFEHRYGDGVDVCIEKGIKALLKGTK